MTARAFSLHDFERAVTQRTEAALTPIAWRLFYAALTIRPACELTAALARRLTRRTR